MIRKVWQLRFVFVLIALAAAFAACVKKKDANVSRDEIRVKLGEITTMINDRDLGELAKNFVQQAPPAKGPNALLAQVSSKGDTLFLMHKRLVSIDGKEATVRFTFSDSPGDSTYSYIYLKDDDGWKIANFEIH